MKQDESPAGTPAEAAPVTSTMPEKVKVEKTFSLPGIALCAAAESTSNARLFVGLSDFSVYQLDPAAEKVEPRILADQKHDSYVTGLVMAGTQLVSASYDGSLIWWNSSDGALVRRISEAHSRWIRMLAVSPDGTRIASVADDMQTHVWDAATGERMAAWGDYEAKTPHGYPSMLYAVTISPNGKWLATGDRTGRILIRDLSTGNIAATLESPVMYTWDPKARHHSIGGVRSVRFSNDSRLLAVGGMGKVGNIDHLDGASRIEVFRWQDQERLFEFEDTTYKGLVEVMAFGPEDNWLMAAGGNHTGFFSIYSLHDGKLLTQEKTGNHVHDFHVQQDGSVVTVGHHQGTVVRIS